MALALGHLLDLLGFARYAALCRSPQTIQIIESWERDWQEGSRTFRRVVERSGLELPGLDDLQWGSVMGICEATFRDEVSELLELAISAGEFTPGAVAGEARRPKSSASFCIAPPSNTAAGPRSRR